MRRLRNFTRGKIALARLLGIGKPCLRGPVNMGGQIRHTLDQRVKILRVERQQSFASPSRCRCSANFRSIALDASYGFYGFFDSVERRIRFGAVGAAGLRHVGPPAALQSRSSSSLSD